MLTCVSDLIRNGAPEGQRNERAFWLACQLRDDRLQPGEARTYMMRFAAHCSPPLHEREAEAAMQQAYKEAPREQAAPERTGARHRVEMVDFDEEAPPDGPGGWDPAHDLVQYLRAVYRDGEHVRILPVLHGQGLSRPASELIEAVKREGITAIGEYDRKDGCWVLHNPTDGAGRKDGNVTDLRHVLVECDDMPAEQQRAIIAELRLPCAAVVDAGNKSVHAIVRIDAGTDAELYRERVERLYNVLEARGYPVDRACRNPARLSRLPGVWRGDRRQWLIATNSGCDNWQAWERYQNSGTRLIVNAADFTAANMAEPDQVVHGVLYRGAKASYGGASKSFKSWCLLDLCISVATGTPWLDIPTTEGRVLYVNFELQEFALWHRIRAVCLAKRMDVPRNLEIWNLRGHIKPFDQLLTAMYAQVDAGRYSLIVPDPIYKMLAGRDENKAGDIADLCNEIESVAVQTGAAVAWGAHFAKGDASGKDHMDRISGSGVWARDPDAVITATAHEEEKCYSVDMTLRNFAPRDPFVVRWEYPLMQRIDANPKSIRQPGPGRKWAPMDVAAVCYADMPYSDLVRGVMAKCDIGERTAKTAINMAVAKSLIEKNSDNKTYSPKEAEQW